ncbi:MAG: DNA topoisomerase I, partial [Clostridia bacterium]|nr:DNA topoisomerase I [Clostridia bacterium]
MSYKLLIVESPAKARTISKYLGRGYKVEASQGHVRDLPKSQLGVDVENNFEPKYITIRGRGDILTRIRKDAKGAAKVFLATDPDREGEAISWHLASMLGIDPEQPCRIEFNEVTSKAIKAAVKNPRPLDINLINAQQARRVLDRLVGYKISPLLWSKVKKGLSAGRVQSVATSMICERENEINTFIPEEYWYVEGQFTSGKTRFNARYAGSVGEKKDLHSKSDADSVLANLKNAPFTVSAARLGERKKYPAPPFTT